MRNTIETGLQQINSEETTSGRGFQSDGSIAQEFFSQVAFDKAKERLSERTLGYDVLFEVNHLLKHIESESDGSFGFSTDALEYVRCNELTAAMEAVTNRFLSVTFQERSDDLGGFRAFGEAETVAEMALRGTKGLSGDQVIKFEKERRWAEYNEALVLDSQYNGMLRDHVLLTISPYPDEVFSEIAGKLGYKFDTKQAMLRWHEVGEEGKKTIYQLNVDNKDYSSVEVFGELLRRFGDSDFEGESTLDILATPIFISKTKFNNGVIDVARMYDSILEEKSNNSKHYFCGREVANETQKVYGDLAKKSEQIIEEGSDLIDLVVSYDMELAKSLFLKSPTLSILSEMEYFVKARNEMGALILDDGQRMILDGCLSDDSGKSFNKDTAKLLKSLETVRVWSLLSCRLNKEQAERVFGEERVERILVAFDSDIVDAGLAWMVLDSAVSQTNELEFKACGIALSSFGGGNMFQSPLSTVMEVSFGFSGESEESYNFDKWTYCVGHNPLEKPEIGKSWCGPCSLCRPCDFQAKLDQLQKG